MGLEAGSGEDGPQRRREDHAHQQAQEPRREERPLDVDDGGAAGGEERERRRRERSRGTHVGVRWGVCYHAPCVSRFPMARARRPPLAASCAGPSVTRGALGRGRGAGIRVIAELVLLSSAGCSMLDAARAPYAAAPAAPATPWRPTESQVQARAATVAARPRVEVETDKVYALADLIDLAQRVNPETR